MKLKPMKKNKRNTIGVMTQSRGTMPPPSRVKQSKKVYSRKKGEKIDW